MAPRAEFELYDLLKDPFELENLASEESHATKLNELRATLAEWSESTGDFLPSQRTPDEFDRDTGAPIPSVRKRPRPSKMDMFGTNGAY